jgi:very-short-patch-repair endonuclease
MEQATEKLRRIKISKSLKNHPCYKNPERSKKISKTKKEKFKNEEYKKKYLSRNKTIFTKGHKKNNSVKRKETILRKYGKFLGFNKGKKWKIKDTSNMHHKPWNKGLNKNINLSVMLMSEKKKISRSKQILPIKDTTIEIKIQNYLKELDIEFQKHKYMHIKHGYQCDIFVPSLNLIIEVDGNYWHKYPFGTNIDKIRTQELIDKGFKVLRLWGSEIQIMDVNKFRKRLYGPTNR